MRAKRMGLLGGVAVVLCWMGSLAQATPGTTMSPRDPAEASLRLAERAFASEPLMDVLLAADDDRWQRDGDWITSPGWRAASRGDFEKLGARLPLHADGVREVGHSRFERFRVRMSLDHARSSEARIVNGRVVYPDVFPATDLVLATGEHRLEEFLILREPQAPSDFSWRMELPHGIRGTRQEPSGAWVLTDARDEAVLRIPAPYAIDARGEHRQATVALEHGWLRVKLPTEGLTYPVVLDPAVEVGVWQFKKSGGFTQRTGQVMAYSPNTKTCLFGGQGSINFGDAWCWDGTNWSQAADPTTGETWERDMTQGPGGIYLYVRQKPSGHRVIKRYNGSSWQTMASWPYAGGCGNQGPDYWAKLAYDGGRGKFVMLGGVWWNGCGGSPYLAESSDASTWVQCQSSGCFGWYFHNYYQNAAFVFSSTVNQVVHFGGTSQGYPLNNTIRGWDGNQWSVLPPGPTSNYTPSMMAQDPFTKRLVLIVGTTTWIFDGSSWTNLVTTTPVGGQAFAWDTTRRRGVLTTNLETWEMYLRGNACTTGADCDTNSCVDGVCCEQASCGSCQACNTAASPGQCATVQNADDDTCTGASTCDGAGVCKKKQGSACGGAGDCLTGYCVDGVCCDAPCAGTCQACSVAAKGGGLDGKCDVVAAGLDPHGSCDDKTASETCGTTGACDGKGSCELRAKGTVCGPSQCAGNTQTGQVCDGLGKCDFDPVGVVCAPYQCLASKCASPCAADSDCIAGHYCAQGECKPTTQVGQACAGNDECTSKHCVDGVCCNDACDKTCSACTAALKGGGQDGECGPIVAGFDPQDECTEQPKESCQNDGTCDGLGGCRKWQSGTKCGDASCQDTFVLGSICNGQGQCASNPSGVNCSPFVCAAGSCVNPCSKNDDCVLGHFCENGSCKVQNSVGSPCQGAAECTSGYCVDGVCCQSACDGICRACSAAKKGGGKDGLCDAVAADTDPNNQCDDDGADSCKRNGFCDGAGDCALYPNKTPISAGQCVGDNGVVKQICDGKGKIIIDSSQSSCDAYRCDPAKGECFTSCADASQCTGVYACINGKCVLPASNGQPCATDGDCSSKHCVSGVCCNESCSGSCESCKLDASPGTCLPIPAGVDPDGPGGTKAKCNGSPEAPSCQGYCNGTERQCFYPGASTICGSACSSSVQTPYACSGNGECVAQSPIPCDPYACDSVTKKCKQNGCATDDDCAQGAQCDTSSKQCVKTSVACAGPFSVKSADGSEQSCKGYQCLDGSGCRDTCAKPNECDASSGYSCQNGKCLQGPGAGGSAGSGGSLATGGNNASQGGAGSVPETAAPASDDGGCGCALPGRTSHSSWTWLLTLAALSTRRMRTSRRS